MKNTHVLLVSPYFYPHIGGSQRYMEELYAHVVKKYPDVHVDVLSCNTAHATKTEEYRGLTIHRIPCWEILPGQFVLPNPVSLIKVLIKLGKNHIDVVHTHIRFFDACWWGWLYAKFSGAASVFTEHVAAHPVHGNSLVSFMGKLIDQTIAAWSIKHYDFVTVTNKSALDFLRETLAVKKDIKLLYGGVDTAYFSPNAIKTRRIPRVAKKIKKNDVIVSFVGRLIWSKGVTYLYDALKQVLPHVPKNVYVVIGGVGKLESTLRQAIEADRLENRVFLTGPLESSQVRTLLSTTDIFIHPSHHNEGFPNVLLEAGASGNFCIATKNGGVQELIRHKKTGVVIAQKNVRAIKNALLWAINNPVDRRAMGKALQESIQTKFDWKLLTQEYYRAILAPRPLYRPGLGLSSYLAQSST